MIIILGAGISGLSCSYHLGHENCIILEKSDHPYGHISSYKRDGFTWDEGPHVSFTKNPYVKELFADSVGNEFDEYEVKVSNYFHSHWINHPAQSSLYQVPEPLRSQCVDSFIQTRSETNLQAKNYQEWLLAAFGPVFTNKFPAIYTEKYWTVTPSSLATNWVGNRVFYPEVKDVVDGSKGPLQEKKHYITTVRYPRAGGFQSYAKKMCDGANIKTNKEVVSVDLIKKQVHVVSGEVFRFDHLINTLPLPLFIKMCMNVPKKILTAAEHLSCSELLLVNVTAHHKTKREENWIYVYDEDKYSTRINCTENLTSANAPSGWTGVQCEVYFSKHRPLRETHEEVAEKVLSELIEMGLIEGTNPEINTHTKYVPWANVIFDLQTKPALEIILNWLEGQGLERSSDDLSPLTDWGEKKAGTKKSIGTLALAGRFGQWKYYWTDDCVLRGAELAGKL
jgi:protoporphyrinogen oxidase